MSSDSDENDVRFHPRYATPQSINARAFRTQDSIDFYFDWCILAQFSSFFNDLRGTNLTGTKPIPLLSATCGAFAFTLDAIRAVFKGRPPGIGYDWTPSFHEEVVAIADAYDLPVVLPALFKHARRMGVDPISLYAIAAIIPDKYEMTALSDAIATTTIDYESKWAERTLMRTAPTELRRIKAYTTRWELLKNPTRLSTSHNFARRCRYRRCALRSKWSGDFDAFALWAFRTLVANTVPSRLAHMTTTCTALSSDCEECSGRLQFVIREHLAGVMQPYGITLPAAVEECIGMEL